MATQSAIHYKTDKLYSLKKALDPDKMKDVFAPIARDHLGANVEVRNVDVEVLRMRNQRCVIRYRVAVDGAPQLGQEPWKVIGKLYKLNEGEPVFGYMKTLYANGFGVEARDGIYIPEPYAFSSPMSMLFQEEVPGKAAKQLLKEELNPFYIRQLARTLAKLHRSNIVPGSPMTLGDHLLRCHPRYPFLFLACPELTDTLNHLLKTSAVLFERWRDVPLASLHGDLHLGQLHLSGEQAYLIDFDALSYGDPASDLGNLVVFLKGKRKRHPEMESIIDALFDEYFNGMDSAIRDRVPLYEGLTHLRRACKVMRYQRDGWQKRIHRMINQGVACLESVI